MVKQRIVRCLVYLCKLLSKKEKKIVYHSFPDFSDNSFATFIYATKQFKEYKNVWVVDNYSSKEKYIKLTSNYSKTRNLHIVKKNSFLGVFHYLTASIVFHTHGLYNVLGLIENQKKVNLWHGMPIKSIGYIDNPKSKTVQVSNYHVATSTFYQKILARAFGVTPNKILVTGQTRNDFIFMNRYSLLDVIPYKKATFKKTILWMPTYRNSAIGDIRVDGDEEEMNEFLNEDFLNELNGFLSKIDSLCVIKLHPMDVLTPNNFKEYSHIAIIDNSNFIDNGISLYSVLNSTDLLLTDFSSIYIDYLLINKPIGFVISDYQNYLNSRGFVFEKPKDFMPGELIESNKELLSFLEDLFINKSDKFFNEREAIKNVFHDVHKSFSEKVFNSLLK